jgi:hypothetical protein
MKVMEGSRMLGIKEKLQYEEQESSLQEGVR